MSDLKNAADDFLFRNQDLKNGLIISLHLGPYSLAPVPWLMAGQNVYILVNKMSLAEIKPIYDELQKHLPLPGKIVWVPIDGSHFALKIVRALKRRNAVFAFLDGNDGLGGSTETLKEGMSYQLPGRKIKVRTGLARLAASCNAPIHSVTTLWPDTGIFAWQRGPTWALSRQSDPEKTTRALFDWAFDVIKKHPAQWKCWNMLTGVYQSFAQDKVIPATKHLPHDATIFWTGRGKLWPGDMLEDVAGQCFFSAEGLTSGNISLLGTIDGISITDLKNKLGTSWVIQHIPRLRALGFVSLE